jgi:superfamily II DNA/RNA helicase
VRQTLFFSATMPPPIKKLADKYLSNPKVITVSPPSSTADNVEQFLVNVGNQRLKTSAFMKVYEQEDVKNAFIFCNRKRDINDVCKFIRSRHIACAPLHGDMEQEERTAALAKFKAAEVQILVCSDVAARGLDVQGLSHVFNWDVPFHAEDYVHRIGRTGRAGAKGRAFTMVTPTDEKALAAIHKLIGKNINVAEFAATGTAGAKAEAETPKPSVQQKERHHNRHQKQDHRHRNHHPDTLAAEANDGSFGEDIPSFLQKK